MSADLETLIEFARDSVWVFSLIMLRVGASLVFLPAFGEQVTPARVKLVAMILFSLILAPTAWPLITSQMKSLSWVGMVGPEIVIGLLIGFIFRGLVYSLQIAGTIAAQSTSLSQSFGGGIGADPQPAFSTLLVIAGLYLAILFGLHIRIVEMFIFSYQIFLAGAWPNPSVFSEWGLKKTSYIFQLGFTLASPFVLASLIYNLSLGVINRAMPQLMVAFVGAPAISLGSLFFLLISSPLILTIWGKEFLKITNPSISGF